MNYIKFITMNKEEQTELPEHVDDFLKSLFE
jgi:hypothetical protein